MKITIREFNSDDIVKCIQLFLDTVHTVNTKDYTSEQVNVWAPKNIDPSDERWQSLLTNISLVAELDNEIVGFIDMTHTGYLDRLYVHKDHQGEGVASALLNAIEKSAKEHSIAEITTEASITAKPFFEKKGFEVREEQSKQVRGVNFKNYLMTKMISI